VINGYDKVIMTGVMQSEISFHQSSAEGGLKLRFFDFAISSYLTLMSCTCFLFEVNVTSSLDSKHAEC